MSKKIKVSKREMIEEHERIVPKLRKAGLKAEAKKQSAELKRLRKR